MITLALSLVACALAARLGVLYERAFGRTAKTVLQLETEIEAARKTAYLRGWRAAALRRCCVPQQRALRLKTRRTEKFSPARRQPGEAKNKTLT